MPLTQPIGARRKLVERAIACEGYMREDGLFDIEGSLRDTRGYSQPNAERGVIQAGEPIHEMRVRLTIDQGGVIQAVESATDHAPYRYCQGVTPNMQALLGLRIAGGFKKAMHQSVGGSIGCTHIVTLLEVLATVAIQTLAGHQKVSGGGRFFDTFATRGADRHPLVGTCRTYAPDSPIDVMNSPTAGVPSQNQALGSKQDMTKKIHCIGWLVGLVFLGIVYANNSHAQSYQVRPVICNGCTTADDLVALANQEIQYYGDDVMLMVVGNDEPITGFFVAAYGDYIPYACEAPGFCYGGYYIRYAAPYGSLSNIYDNDNRIFARKIPFAVQVPTGFVDSAGGSAPSADLASVYMSFRFQFRPDTSAWGIILAFFGQGRFIAKDNMTQIEYTLSRGDQITVRFADGTSMKLEFTGMVGSVAAFTEVPGSRMDANGNPMDPPVAGGGGSWGEVQTIETGGVTFSVAENVVNVTTCIPMEFTVAVNNSDGSSGGTFTYRSCV